jgi:hypothetical protein
MIEKMFSEIGFTPPGLREQNYIRRDCAREKVSDDYVDAAGKGSPSSGFQFHKPRVKHFRRILSLGLKGKLNA